MMLTPEEYVYSQVNRYPILYGSETYEESALGVFDQLFNVIGNGWFTVADWLVRGVVGVIPVRHSKHIGTPSKFPFVPYPNFTKEYSFVYKEGFEHLGSDWVDATIWFYRECEKFFDTTPELYHAAFPTNSKAENELRLNEFYDYNRGLSHREVSERYGLPFDGDIDEFLVMRWQIELIRIRKFIKETINYLKEMK